MFEWLKACPPYWRHDWKFVTYIKVPDYSTPYSNKTPFFSGEKQECTRCHKTREICYTELMGPL